MAQSDQIERRSVRGAVIGRMWDQLEMRTLAVTHSVQYFAGLGIAVGVLLRCLKAPSTSNAPRANSGQIRVFCSATIRLSRPNGATNQGRPAAGRKTM